MKYLKYEQECFKEAQIVGILNGFKNEPFFYTSNGDFLRRNFKYR